MLLIYTNAQLSSGGGLLCHECEAEISYGTHQDVVQSYRHKQEINNMLDEMKLEAALNGMANKSLEEIETFFKSKS